jgi:uncharacterized protein YlaI
MKCIICETDIILQSSDEEPRRISNEPVCEECYFRSLGEAIEKHPIGIRFYKPEPQTKPYPHCKDGCKFIIAGECKYREMHVPTIAVDFDKVLFTHESWQGHYHYGEPLPGAKEALIELQRMGFKIMIWTTRDQTDIITAACLRYDIPFDFINTNPNQPPEINPSKPVADYYIDDRAVHFRSWDQALSEIKSREVHDQYYPIKKESE